MDEHGNVVSGEVRWFFVSWGMMTDAAVMRHDTIRVVVAVIDNEHTPLGVAAFTYGEQVNEILSDLVVTADTPTAIRPTTWGSVKNEAELRPQTGLDPGPGGGLNDGG